MKIGIFYGSTTGNAQSVAGLIAKAFAGEDVEVRQAGEFCPGVVQDYDLLICGSSTWGDGELQDDWISPSELLGAADYSNCKAAVFGLGDGNGWADTFADAMKILYDKLKAGGAEIIGSWPVSDYEFDISASIVEGKFVGLAIDESNQPDLTGQRINQWVEQLKAEYAGQPA